MCFRSKSEPLPQPLRPMTDLGRLIDDLLGYVAAWAKCAFTAADAA